MRGDQGDGAEDDLAAILDAESVDLEGYFVESEDVLSQTCSVTSDDNEGGDTELSIRLDQASGIGHMRHEDDAQAVFPGCLLQPKAPSGTLEVRAYCEPGLVLDVDPDFLRDSAVQPWPEGSNGPAQEYADLLHDVLVGVSHQG